MPCWDPSGNRGLAPINNVVDFLEKEKIDGTVFFLRAGPT